VGHLAGERVVHEDVGALLVWREAPDGARGEKVPVVPLLKEGAELLAVPAHRDEAVLDVLGEALLERLGDHGQLRAAVGCLGKALERARLYDGLTEGDDRVGYLDLHAAARVDVSQVVHHAVDEELARAHDHMLAALLHLGAQQRVA